MIAAARALTERCLRITPTAIVGVVLMEDDGNEYSDFISVHGKTHGVKVDNKLERPNIKMRRTKHEFTDKKTGEKKFNWKYNKDDSRALAAHKFDRTRHLAMNFDKVEGTLRREATGEGFDKKRFAAVALLTGMHVGSRPGNNDSVFKPTKKGKPTYGLTTLLGKHVKVEGDTVHLDFPGKDNVRNRYAVRDAGLAKAYKEIKHGVPDTAQIFSWAPHSRGALTDEHLRERMRQFHKSYKTKDLRTAHGNRIAAAHIEHLVEKHKDMRIPASREAQTKIAKDIIKGLGHHVAQKLSNTPEVAIRHYVDPAMVESLFSRIGFKGNPLPKPKTRAKKKAEESFDGSFDTMLHAIHLHKQTPHLPVIRKLFGNSGIDKWLASHAVTDASDDPTDRAGIPIYGVIQ